MSANQFTIETNGQRWLTEWHAGESAPPGTPHGAAGICLTETHEIVLVSADGVTWDLPAGRTEGDETWEQTLHREVHEEACAVVTRAKLLGFSRGECIEGPERGLVLARSIWLADVQLLDWRPKFEMSHRRTARPQAALSLIPPTYLPIWQNAFATLDPGLHLCRI